MGALGGEKQEEECQLLPLHTKKKILSKCTSITDPAVNLLLNTMLVSLHLFEELSTDFSTAIIQILKLMHLFLCQGCGPGQCDCARASFLIKFLSKRGFVQLGGKLSQKDPSELTTIYN